MRAWGTDAISGCLDALVSRRLCASLFAYIQPPCSHLHASASELRLKQAHRDPHEQSHSCSWCWTCCSSADGCPQSVGEGVEGGVSGEGACSAALAGWSSGESVAAAISEQPVGWEKVGEVCG